MWKRWERFQAGKEPLLSMAYFVLTVLTNVVGSSRRDTARSINVDLAILNRLGELSSNRGDAGTARKATAHAPLTDLEERWIRAAVPALIRSTAQAGTPASQKLRLSDLPSL